MIACAPTDIHTPDVIQTDFTNKKHCQRKERTQLQRLGQTGRGVERDM
jgi:hypothetical protein